MANQEISRAIGIKGMSAPDTPFTQPPDALMDGFLACNTEVAFALRTYAEVSDMLEACSISNDSLNMYLLDVLHLGSKGYASAIKSVLNATVPDMSRIDVFGSSSLTDYEQADDHPEDDVYERDVDLEIGEAAAYQYSQLVEALAECDVPYAREKLDFITHVFATGGQNNLGRQSVSLFLENRLTVKRARALPDIDSE